MSGRNRQEKERALREAAERLLSALEEIERSAEGLIEAEEQALHQRAKTLIASGLRLQEDVALALGDTIRERVVEEFSRRPPEPPSRRNLSVA